MKSRLLQLLDLVIVGALVLGALAYGRWWLAALCVWAIAETVAGHRHLRRLELLHAHVAWIERTAAAHGLLPLFIPGVLHDPAAPARAADRGAARRPDLEDVDDFPQPGAPDA